MNNKKNFINIFLGAGIAMIMLSDCSKEERSLSQQEMAAVVSNTGVDNKTAVLAVVKDASILKGMFANSEVEGWSTGDDIRIYTLQSMSYNSYLLSEGGGSPVATFTRIGGTEDYDDDGTLYAVTSSKYVYGLSATADGQARLTVDIPSRYDITDAGGMEGCTRLTTPYWGEATFNSDGNLDCPFSGLTAMLKIETTSLPAGTRAVVLTTHNYTDLDGKALDGGDDKPLSGTFDAVLRKGAALEPNPIFYSYDTLRVNLGREDEREEYKSLYLPVIAGQYANLHVIAVMGDTRRPYDWQGSVIQTFKENIIFRPNTIITVGQSTGIMSPRI